MIKVTYRGPSRTRPGEDVWDAVFGFLSASGPTAQAALERMWKTCPKTHALIFPRAHRIHPPSNLGPTGAYSDPAEWVRYVIEGGPKPGPLAPA